MNIYRIAHGGRKPYRIITLAHGVETDHGVLWAFSSEQARGYAIQKYAKLQDDLEMGYEIVARLDKAKLAEYQKEQQEIEDFQKNKKEELEEFVQNAWWNK